MVNTDLAIIGCGAAGLLAAVTAGELGLRCVVLERRHRVGLKLLMCGNNRCNVSHAFSTEEMLKAYGGDIGDFLRPAMTAFSPQVLRSWFARNGLATCIKNERVYPTTEKGDDVLHCFTDRMRELEVPLMLNCAVSRIQPTEGGILVECDNMAFVAKNVLLATGGVSYPKTGSVGDGQRMMSELGVAVTPLRAGLAGVDVRDAWLQVSEKAEFPLVRVCVVSDGRVVGETEGNLLCEGGCLRGTAMFDATRLIARMQLSSFGMTLDVCPQMGAAAVEAKLSRGGLSSLGVPDAFLRTLEMQLPAQNAARWLKALPLDVAGIRPLKEAIVTVGGVALSEVDSATMAVRKLPGVYVAGELLDVDGPTGGFNLHAAFATGHLAATAIAASLGAGRRPAKKPEDDGDSRRGNGRMARPAEPREKHYGERNEKRYGGGRDGEHRPMASERWDNSDTIRGFAHGRYGQDGRGGNAVRGTAGDGRQERRGWKADESTAGETRSGRSYYDSKKGNRWDNSEFEQKRLSRPEQGDSSKGRGKGPRPQDNRW